MIDSRELMINNVVWFAPYQNRNKETTPRYVKVKRILDKSAIFIDGYLEIELFYEGTTLQPVALTANILLKCGFKKLEYGLSERVVRYELEFGYGNGLIVFNNDGFHLANSTDSFYETPLEIGHLHKLQNLYYALTGNELKMSDFF